MSAELDVQSAAIQILLEETSFISEMVEGVVAEVTINGGGFVWIVTFCIFD